MIKLPLRDANILSYPGLLTINAFTLKLKI